MSTVLHIEGLQEQLLPLFVVVFTFILWKKWTDRGWGRAILSYKLTSPKAELNQLQKILNASEANKIHTFTHLLTYPFIHFQAGVYLVKHRALSRPQKLTNKVGVSWELESSWDQWAAMHILQNRALLRRGLYAWVHVWHWVKHVRAVTSVHIQR